MSEQVKTFSQWLMRQTKRDDPIGDLARDAISDASKPLEMESADAWEMYLSSRVSPMMVDVIMNVLADARAEFLASLRRSRRSPISARLRWEVLGRDEFACVACGRTPKGDGVVLHVDHIIPVAAGGQTEADNLQTLCSECNLGKSDIVPTGKNLKYMRE